MFFTLEKLKVRTEQLKSRRYFGNQCIAPFVSMEGTLDKADHYHELPEKIEGPEFGIGDVFKGLDRYLWMEKEVQIPEAKEGCEVVGLFDFGKTGPSFLYGFESMLYVDGHPYQGVDTNHHEVFFGGEEGKTRKLTFLLWTGLEGWINDPYVLGPDGEFSHICRQADFAYLHIKTDELYYFARTITETLKWLDKNHEQYEDLKALLDRTLNMIDWDGPDFYETVDEAHDFLMNGLNHMEKRSDVTVHVVGHTHIDVAWLWRLKHTREKAQRSFSTVMRLMERYEEYIFLQSQPQLYKYIKEDCPELFEQIKKRAAEGRWEPEGGMWIEADCNVTSGESLVRQLLHGTRFIEKEFGKKCEYLWLPDVFGYSWALPQILKQCEISTFMTNKTVFNQYDRMPNHIFKWRGVDGSEILSYFLCAPWAGTDGSDYNNQLNPGDVMQSWKTFKNKDLSKDLLVSFGFGDGGGGPTRDMLEMRRVMDIIPGQPNVKPAKAGDFFRKLHENVENTDRYVATWDGEIYLEYHRGTYTTQAYNKKTNRHLEHKLAQIEWLSSLNYALGGEYEQQELNDSWECVLLNQFHDIIPGSSIHEVYEDSKIDYRAAEDRADRVQAAALQALKKTSAEEDHTYTIYTTNSFAGEELVLLPEKENGIFTDSNGQQLPAQKTADGYEVLVRTEPFAAVTVRFEALTDAQAAEEAAALADGQAAEEAAALAVGQETSQILPAENGLETPFYSIRWNENGEIIWLYDKEAKRRVFEEGRSGNVLEFYEDKPLMHDAWDIDIYYTQKAPEHARLEGKPQIVELGDLKTVVRFCYRYRESSICQDMIVYGHSRRIDFKTHVDWKESRKLFKTAFYTDIRSAAATYDIQFAHAQRPTHWNTSWDWARFEVCGHKWADLSEDGYGVSLLNDCKYGYSIKDAAMKLSLLKSSKWPDHSADMGEHDFTYALLPHMGSLTGGGTIEEANQLNLPAQVTAGSFADSRKLVKVSTDRVQLDVVKKAEDEACLIVRLHECRGGRTTVALSSEFPVKRIVPCNMLEHDCGEAIEGNCAEFEMKPFEIRNYKLYL